MLLWSIWEEAGVQGQLAEHVADQQLVNRKGARDPTVDSSLSTGVPAIGGKQENVHILKAWPSDSETPSHIFTPIHLPTPIEIAGLFVCETEEFKLPFFYTYETKSAVFSLYV